MSLDLKKIEKYYLENDENTIFNEHLMGHEVWYIKDYLKIQNYSKSYDDIKKYISGKLDTILFPNIEIVGSAKTGYSFNPKDKFRSFRTLETKIEKSSDIDILLVSEKLYMRFWEAYLEMYNGFTDISSYQYITSCIFKGFIYPDSLDLSIETYQEWLKQVDSFKKDLQTIFGIKHDINYRIFKSWEHAKSYYTRNIKRIKYILEK